MTDEENFDQPFEISPDEEMGDVAGAQTKIKSLRDQLKEAQAKAAENLDGWQRAKADAVNMKREAQASAARSIEREKDWFIESLLPVLDSFDMAMQNEAVASMGEVWQKGMGAMHNQLLRVLETHGAKRFGKVGELVDPRRHEAVQEVDDMPGESHTIVKILRHGYQADASQSPRIIRPAQVIIKK